MGPVLNERRDAGFTLMEMLIAITILGVITVPLVSAFALGLGQTRSSNQTVTNSADAQLLASFFPSDIASAANVNTTGSCGSGPLATTVIQLDNGVGATPRFVAYVATESADSEAQLHLGAPNAAYHLDRIACDALSATISDTLVANSLSAVPSFTTVPPSLTCVPAVGGAASDCATTPNARSVSVTLAEWEANSSDPKYQFTITGTRRAVT